MSTGITNGQIAALVNVSFDLEPSKPSCVRALRRAGFITRSRDALAGWSAWRLTPKGNAVLKSMPAELGDEDDDER